MEEKRSGEVIWGEEGCGEFHREEREAEKGGR